VGSSTGRRDRPTAGNPASRTAADGLDRFIHRPRGCLLSSPPTCGGAC
jgi:hypothetical protein